MTQRRYPPPLKATEQRDKPVKRQVATSLRGEPKTDEENTQALKWYFEDRWARGVVRDFSAPDLWGDNPKPKRRVLG